MGLSSLLLLSVFVFAVINAQSLPSGCVPKGVVNGRYTVEDGTYDIQWKVDCDSETFSALIAAEQQTGQNGWIGFGLNNVARMIGGYVIQIRINTSNVVDYRVGHNVDDNAYNTGPTTIPENPYSGVNATRNATHLIVGFTRGITLTGDDASLFSIDPSGNIFLWAYQDSTNDWTIQHTESAAVSINFYTGTASKFTDYKLIHGALMLLAFGFLAPAGTFVARYLKGIGHPWYLIHIGIQYTLLAIMLASFIIIENNLGKGTKSHFQHPHNIIGLTIVILTFIQVLLGIVSNALFKPDRDKPPYFPDKAHWWLGRLVILYAFANIFVGFDQYGFTHKHDQPFIGFAVWLGIVAVLFLIAEVLTGQSHHVNDSGNKLAQYKYPIIVYITMFALGFILYGVTLHEMYNGKGITEKS